MIIAGVGWGTGGLFGSLLADRAQVSAVVVAACRLLGGGLIVLSTFAFRRSGWMTTAGSRRLICAIGVLAALFQTGYFAAVTLINLSTATLITIAAAPVVVSLAEIAAGRRRFTARLGLILVLTVGGLCLLVGSPVDGIEPSALAAGTVAALASSACFATMTLAVAHSRSTIDPARLTGFGFTLGGLLLIPVAAVTGGTGAMLINPTGVLAAIGLALIPTAISYSLYFRALTTLPATTASVLAIIEPLTAAVLGHGVLGEELSLSAVVGGVLLLLAIVGAAREAATPR